MTDDMEKASAVAATEASEKNAQDRKTPDMPLIVPSEASRTPWPHLGTPIHRVPKTLDRIQYDNYADSTRPLFAEIHADGSAHLAIGDGITACEADLTPMQVRGLWLLLARAVAAFTGGTEDRA